MLTYIMIFVFFAMFAIIVLYIVQTFVVPKKIDELAQMIEAGQTKLAIKKLNDVLEKDDRNAYAHFLLGTAYLKENNIQYGIVEYRQVLKLAKFDDKVRETVVRSNLAKLYKDRKSLEEAKNEYLILTKIDPANFENYFELGKIFFDVNVMEKAAGFFKKSLASNPNYEPSYYYLGQINYRAGTYVDAKQMFINSIKLDPSNYKSHYYLGLVLRQIGDYEWAIKEFETAQKSDELKVKAFLAKGSCLMDKVQYPKAIMEFERGLKFSKRGSETDLNLRYFMAECHEKMRDIHSAIVNWEKIAESNNNFRDVQEKLRNYSEFRQDDRIKDFMIAGLSQFEHMTRKMVESMGFNVMEIEIINDTEIEIIASDSEGKWRNARQFNKIIRVIRTTDQVQERLLRTLHEGLKLKNALRVVIITAGDFDSKSIEFANTRPIDLFGKTELINLLKKI